jgi:hypothetical protein
MKLALSKASEEYGEIQNLGEHHRIDSLIVSSINLILVV